MTNLKSGKLKRPMKVLDAKSMLSIKGGKGGKRGGSKNSGAGGGVPPTGTMDG